jgi:hypothetical protein
MDGCCHAGWASNGREIDSKMAAHIKIKKKIIKKGMRFELQPS